MLSYTRKILVISESINVEDSSGSKANVALILNLRDAGFKVTVAHFTRREIQLPKIKCISIREKKLSVTYLLSRSQRKIQQFFGINLAKYLERLFGFSFTFFNDSASIVVGIKQLWERDIDMVITLSKGASFRPHHALLNLPNLHNKWMAYIHDPYPFHYYPDPYRWSEPGYKEKIMFFQEVSKKCRWAAFPSLLLAEWMTKRYPDFHKKNVIVPHQLRHENIKSRFPDYFNPEQFNLLHAGNLMKQRSPFSLIEGFLRFLDSHPKAKAHSKLLLIGSSGYHRKRLRFYMEQENIFISEGTLEYHQVLNMQQKVTINIILESKAFSSPFLPGKFPHCVAANKPILLLGPEKSETRRLLGKEYPYWSEADDVEEISILIANLYDQWVKNASSLRLNRKDLEEYLSSTNLNRTLKSLSV